MQAEINLNGKSHALYFGLMALEIFFEKQGTVKQGTTLNIKQIVAMVWGGLENAAFRSGEPHGLSEQEVYDAVEEMYSTAEGGQQLLTASNAFANSQKVKEFSESGKKKPKAK